jgi:hypothetical protein
MKQTFINGAIYPYLGPETMTHIKVATPQSLAEDSVLILTLHSTLCSEVVKIYMKSKSIFLYLTLECAPDS